MNREEFSGRNEEETEGENEMKEEPENGKKEEGSFECNICFDSATDPCVTSCGHLYCWPCIYRWLHSSSAKEQTCPVCKSGISESTITPIYGRGKEKTTKSRPSTSGDSTNAEETPHRPRGERQVPQPNPNYRPNNFINFNPFDLFGGNNVQDGVQVRYVNLNFDLRRILGSFFSPSEELRLRSRHCLSALFFFLGFLGLMLLIVFF